MDKENQPLVTDELVEFETTPEEVRKFRRITDHFMGIYIQNIPQMNESNTGRWQHVTGGM